jgi:hypothetical protein
VLQADFELMDAWCIESELAEPEGLSQRPTRSVQAVGDEIPTTLDGLELSFDVAADSVTECFFINTSGGVEEATGTPVITAGPTLPPTDLEGSAAPLSDTWRMALIALAGILASVLVMTPARSTRRR